VPSAISGSAVRLRVIHAGLIASVRRWCGGAGLASCSVRVGPDGTLQVNCFECELAGDVLTLIAAARGINIRSDLPDVLRAGCEFAGLTFDA
jgi:hypothetical protein